MPALAQISAVFTHQALAAAGAGAVAIPLLIHLLSRLRRPREPWGAMRFLVEAVRRQRRRMQVEHWLLLTIRCLILLILGLALSGPLVSGWAGRMGDAGRLVCLVIDDSLTTQAVDSGGRARFELIQHAALRVIDQLTPADRVAVWRTARPAQPVQELAGAASPELARERIDAMAPRYSRSDIPAALQAVSAALTDDPTPPDRTMVVLISDFSQSAVPADQPLPNGLAVLGTRARLMTVRPQPGANNVQIASVTPRRRSILAPGGQPTVSPGIEVRLRRFGNTADTLDTTVEITARGPDPAAKPLAVSREHHWSPGQSVAVLNIELPLTPAHLTPSVFGRDPDASAVDSPTLSLTTLVRTAAADRLDDALAADNHHTTLLAVRNELRVALIDSPLDLHGSSGDEDPTPAQWLRLALAPGSMPRSTGDGDSVNLTGVVLTTLGPERLDADTTAAHDAMFVLRPDLIDETGWHDLADATRRGALVWVVAPSIAAPPAWADAMFAAFDLDWRVAAETREYSGDEQIGWSLSTAGPVPEPLGLLGADWPALLRPVRLARMIDLATRDAPDVAWISTDSGSPVLAVAGVGRGFAVMLTAAIDSGWTNLPTRPLFVPLLHETLRALLGGAAPNEHLTPVVAGDRPTLGSRWRGADGITLAATPNSPPVSIPLRPASSSPNDSHSPAIASVVEPVTALDHPGTYHPTSSSTGSISLVVNADPGSGNTAYTDPDRLLQWLAPTGEWAWLSPTASSLAAHQTRANLGWPLLWVTAGLILLETCLARWFSHARAVAGGSFRRGITADLTHQSPSAEAASA